MATDVFELFAKLNMDSSDFDKGLDSVGSKATSALTTIGKAVAGAVTAGATAIGALAKQAVSSYSDYEQNAGGIKKLYGDAYDTVMKQAVNAYQTSGMSANQYMETATAFSASLIQSTDSSLDAAKQTDVAMKAISDNWNTFGGDLESITNAYKGFSKQNYTMLDNLKLGYGGTKDEMERLISDANDYAKSIGQASDLSIDSFSDIVTAIELVQEKNGIAGTTAKEAQTTIQGSLNMTKMAWENLLVAFGNTEVEGYLDNVGEAVDSFVSSAKVAFENILPVVEKALEGIAQAIQTVIPIISAELPTMIETLLPSLITSATSLVSGLVNSLPTILTVLIEAIPTILSTLATAIDWSTFGTTLITSFTTVFDTVNTWLQSLLPSQFTQQGADAISNMATGIVNSLGTLTASLGSLLGSAIELIISYLPQFLTTAVELVGQMALGIVNNLPTFITSLTDLIARGIDTLMQNLPQFLAKGGEMIVKLATGIANNIPSIVSAILNGITKLISTLTSNLPQFMTKGGEIVGKLATGITGSVYKVAQAIVQVTEKIISGVKSLPSQMLQWGKDMIQSLINGIKSMIGSVGSAISGVASKIKSFIHFSEPDEGPLSNFHTYAPDMMKTFAKGITDNAYLLDDAFNDSLGFAKDGIQTSMNVDANVVGSASALGNSIVMNIYASDGMDVNELAQKVSDKLSKSIKRGASFA